MRISTKDNKLKS